MGNGKRINKLDIAAKNWAEYEVQNSWVIKELRDIYIKGFKKGAEEARFAMKKYDWVPVSERNPDIDMTKPTSKYYFVKYEDGGYDVASFCSYNIFWTDHVAREPWWNCAQYCKVEAWKEIEEFEGES